MTPDMELALVVSSLFRDTPSKPRGTLLWPGKRDLLLADRALAGYFASVADADAWADERDRVRQAAGATGSPMNVYAIRAMLPIWRQWGRMLVDAGEAPDLREMFVPPGGYDT